MLLPLITIAAAAPVERLDGVHLGIGVGLGWYSYTMVSGDEVLSQASVSSFAGARVRLNRRWGIEPSVLVLHTDEAGSTRSQGITYSNTLQTTQWQAGLRTTRVAGSLDRVDLLMAIGVSGGRVNFVSTATQTDVNESEPADRFERWNAAGEVGLGIEYWIEPRLSLGADLATQFIEYSISDSTTNDREDESLELAFHPTGNLVLRLYF